MNSAKKGELMAPLLLAATSGDMDGEVDLVWEPVNESSSYVVQVSRSRIKPSDWIQEDVVTRSSYTVSKLKSGYQYWFRVSAVTSKGQGPWSEPVSKKAP